jgi:hypothetical protein
VVRLRIFGGEQLPAFGVAAPDQHVVIGRSKSSGQTATLGPGPAQNSYLHPAVRW